MIHELNKEAEQVRDLLASQPNWEARYRQLLLLGKKQALNVDIQQPENEVSGCQAKVWLVISMHNDRLHMQFASDSRIVKALLYVLTLPILNETSEVISQFQPEHWMKQCELSAHLNSSRVNGLISVIAKIQEAVQNN